MRTDPPSSNGLVGWLRTTARPNDRAAAARTAAIFTVVSAGLLVVKNVVAYLLYGSTEPSGIPTSTGAFVVGTIAVPALLVVAGLLFQHPRVVRSMIVGLSGSIVTISLLFAMLIGFEDHSAGSQLYLVFSVVWAAYYLRPVAAGIAVTLVLIGVVILDSTDHREGPSSVVYLIVTIVLVAVMIVRLRQRTAVTEAALERQIRSDALTGLATRPVLDAVGADLIGAGATTPALIVVDVDHFKNVNDRHGHLAGDAVLRHLAGELSRATGTRDVAARLGGDEFAVLLADADARSAMAIGEAIVEAVRGAPVRTAPGSQVRYTVSVGVAIAVAGVDDVESLYAAADRALYRAKSDGRDCAAVVSG